MIDILLKYILWYEFSKDFDAQSDFDKNYVPKKPAGQVEPVSRTEIYWKLLKNMSKSQLTVHEM